MPTGQPGLPSSAQPLDPTAAGSTEATGRRWVLRGLFASGVGVALSPVLGASGSVGREELWFDVTYGGSRIVGGTYDAGRPGDPSSGWRVTVDGRPLHLMRRADGSWMSMVDHYRSYPTLLTAACAAVDELGLTARLGEPGDSASPSGGEGAERDHHSGVHP